MISILFKAILMWFLIFLVAIVNGTIREKIIVPIVGTNIALPFSGVSMAILVFVVSLVFIPFIGITEQKGYLAIGFLWVVLTLLFEFIFGHFIMGKTWQDILQVFNIKEGNLFIIILFVTAISPLFAAKIRGLC